MERQYERMEKGIEGQCFDITKVEAKKGYVLDVETVLARSQAGELGLDVNGGILGLLGEVDGSGNVLVVLGENADSLDHDEMCLCGGEGWRGE